MNVAVVLLDYYRHTYTEQVKASLYRGGYPFDLFVIDRIGISAALNEGIDKTREYDAVAFCGNDIEMPDNWLLKAVEHLEAIPNTGMCGIYCVETLPPTETINGISIHPNWATFGNVVIPRKAIDTIGYFNTKFDPYGMQDSDYGLRLTRTGFINYYMRDCQSRHLGHDIGEQSEYRKMKDEGLNKAGEIWGECTKYYEEQNDYTIFFKEW